MQQRVTYLCLFKVVFRAALTLSTETELSENIITLGGFGETEYA